MQSIGLRLEPFVKRGLLQFHSARPSFYGLEMHLATMFKEIGTFQPDVVIVDPITSLTQGGFVQLVIQDDGIGFAPERHPAGRKKTGGLGLLSMRERATYVGGVLEVKSSPRSGTEIAVRIPLPRQME